jgi:hypothetical protein
MQLKSFFFAALTAAFLSVANYTAAQVTIGSGEEPKAGAVLDLNSQSGAKGGLLLSNIHLNKLTHIPAGNNLFPGIVAGSTGDTGDDVNPALSGMMVFNTNELLDFGKGLYAWDGSNWNYLGGGTGLASPTFTCDCGSTMTIPPVVFFPYNLGADPKYNTPKKQMAYLASNAYNANDTTVLGALYQWGRVKDGHEKRGSNTHSGPIADANTDNYGQPKASYGKGLFIKNSSSPYNWRSQKDDLWGNGKGLSADGTNNGGVLYSSNYYQNTNWTISQNNPCPSGFRIPTQDEWERIINYDCNPSSVQTASFNNITTAGKTTDKGFTWVPVDCNNFSSGKCIPNTNNWDGNKSAGYAVYADATWANADTEYKNGNTSLHDPDAPEPHLFLPAGGHLYNDASLKRDATFGYGSYWSSTVSGTNASFLQLNNSEVKMDAHNRVYALSVRCVAK